MRHMINFKDNREKTMNKVKQEFIKPEYVYIRIDDPLHVVIKPGSYIYKGQILGISDMPYRLPVLSTISGTYIETVNENGSHYIKIENDFLEKYERRIGYKKNLANYKKNEFVDLLYRMALVGQGGAGFPTYLKYQGTVPINLLIVNAVECEPDLTTDYAVMLMHTENILDSIEAILAINKIERAVIAINSEYVDVINKFNEYLGSYPEISLQLIDVKYASGASKILVETVTGEKYKKHACEVGVVVNNVSTIYDIYRILKYRRPITEKLITLAGEKLAKPQNILVKIGMKASDLGLKVPEDTTIVLGGPLMGTSFRDLNFVIENTSLAIMFLNQQNKTVEPCINCNLCQIYCPMGVKVLAAKRAFATGKYHLLEKTNVVNCIECGLCSYVCPSHISLREIMVKAKKQVKHEK